MQKLAAWESAKVIFAAYNEAVEASLGNIWLGREPRIEAERAELLLESYRELIAISEGKRGSEK